ncbi:flagellar biosynthetic protein FliQ [Candidatus Riflebacteria bacterium]
MYIFFGEVIILASPVLVISLVVGLIVAVIQSTTQIQEQTLTFVPKFFALLLILVLSGGWFLVVFSNFIFRVYDNLWVLIRMIRLMSAANSF